MPTYSALLSAAGPGGLFATLDSSRLIVRCADTKTLLRNIDVDPKVASSIRHIKWYDTKQLEDPDKPVRRLLLATNENVHVYDISNPRWQANIRKACGDGGKIASVSFGAHGDEIVALSAFNLKLCVWSLETGCATEIRDPKGPSSKAFSVREQSGHLAVLSRASAKDTIAVLSPDKKEAEYTFHPSTIDAQGLKWSPDGRWIVVWDTPTAGTGVSIYTATGQLFKKFTGGGDADDLAYGVDRVEWDRENRYLLVIMKDGKAVFLDTNAFQPKMVFEYPSKIASQYAQIHIEQITTDGARSYTLVEDAVFPPASASAIGFNFVAISPFSNLLACVSAKLPTTVWIHTIHPNPQLTSVLVHHGTVKHLSWHPSIEGLLLTQMSANGPGQPQDALNMQSNPNVYIWGYDLPEPRIVPIGAAETSPITAATWLKSAAEPRALISTSSICSTIHILNPEEEEDEGEFPTPKPAPPQKQKFSVDATPTQMLGFSSETPRVPRTSDFTPIKMDTQQLTKTLGFQFTSLGDYDTDDTFDYKKQKGSELHLATPSSM